MFNVTTVHSTPGRGAEYCDEHVCLLSVSVRTSTSGTTRPNFTKFTVHATHGRGSIFLWWRRVAICYLFPVSWMTPRLHKTALVTIICDFP